jgi:hypothetical protein
VNFTSVTRHETALLIVTTPRMSKPAIMTRFRNILIYLKTELISYKSGVRREGEALNQIKRILNPRTSGCS